MSWSRPKSGAQRRVHGLENQDVSKGSKLFLPLFFKVFFSLVLDVEIVQKWKTFHGWRKTLLSAHPPAIPFLNTSNVDMAGFLNPHKVVVRRNAFLVLGNAQNEGVLEVKT